MKEDLSTKEIEPIDYANLKPPPAMSAFLEELNSLQVNGSYLSGSLCTWPLLFAKESHLKRFAGFDCEEPSAWKHFASERWGALVGKSPVEGNGR
jgi:hypothetical protein